MMIQHQLNGYFIKNNGDVTSQMIIQIGDDFPPPHPTDPDEVVPPFTRAPVVAYAWPGGHGVIGSLGML